MALVLYDRVQQTGTANTTVSFTLSGSVTGFQSFAVVGNGNTTYYSATDASGNWEVGIGTYATGGTLTRTTILSSSNSGSAVTFSGSVNVFVTYPSGKSVNLDASGNATSLGTPASFVGTNITGTASGLSIGGNAATATSATTATNQSGGTVSATTISASGVITSTLATGTAPFTVASTTAVANLSIGGNAATATSATSATNATNVANTTTTSASTFYPAFMSANTTSNQGTNTNASLSYVPSTGALTAVSMVSSSDERLKTNWSNLDLNFVSQLADVKHGTFERISSGNREVGVTAQSLKEILPEAVIEGEDGMLSVNYGGAALVAAIELAKEVKALRAEIAELKAR